MDTAVESLEISGLPPCPLTRGGKPPKIGSAEWCACIDELRAWFRSVGESALEWLLPSKSGQEPSSWWAALLRSVNPVSNALDAAKAIAGALTDQWAKRIDSFVVALRDAVTQSSVCNPSEMLGLELCRSLLGALHNLRIGTDALAWITVDIRVSIGVLERVLEYVIAASCPTEIPSIFEARECYLAATAPEGLIRCWTAFHGADWDVWEPVVRARRRKPELIESFTLRNREQITDGQLDGSLRQLGFTDPLERRLLTGLRFEVPGPSDLVRFAVREGFTPRLVKKFGYDQEYQPILDAFHRCQGVDYPIFSGPLKSAITAVETENGLAPGTFLASYAEAGLPEPTWAQLYWWSHWQLPSPGQGYSFLQRARGNPADPRTWRIPGLKPFTSEDLGDLLRANDYPVGFRKYLEAVSYSPPSMRFLRVQLKQGTIDAAEASEQLQDIGYRKELADSMAVALAGEINEQKARQVHRTTRAAIEGQWQLGLISDQEALELLEDLRIPEAERKAELQRMIADRQLEIGTKLVKQLHAAYLRGHWDWVTIDRLLSHVGIRDNVKAEYRRLWDAEREATAKESTAAQLVKYTVEGLIDVPDLARRLRNLNYTDDAIGLILADVRYQTSVRQARISTRQAADFAKRERAGRQAVKALREAEREARRNLASHGSAAKLKAWYCDGLISADDVSARLHQLGWPDQDVRRLLGECDAKRQKAGLPTYSEEAGKT